MDNPKLVALQESPWKYIGAEMFLSKQFPHRRINPSCDWWKITSMDWLGV